MKLDRMEVILEPAQAAYFPGQCIQGRLVIELNKDMKVRGVRIKLRGKGHVYWTTGSGDNKSTYTETENYIDNSVIVFGSGPETDTTTYLTAGSHSFPFQFVLPLEIPGSYEGKEKCYVRYFIKGTIDRPWKFDPECKTLFTLADVLDLNTIPGTLNSAQTQDSKTVCCCCCESEPITASFRIDRTGYVPGESIICNAEIDDKTERGVCSTKIKLIMKTIYRTHGGSKDTHYDEVAKIKHGAIAPNGTDVFSGEALLIPPTPPSYLNHCDIIDIEYYVQMCVDVVDTPFDLVLELEITIGTIPHQSVVQQYLQNFPPPPVTNQPAGVSGPFPGITPAPEAGPSPGAIGPGFGAPVNFDCPPPSYEECFSGKVDTLDEDDKHTMGNTSYAPTYTYYNWMNHPAP